jgi:two-component system chemotaxis sensor kinase CheA
VPVTVERGEARCRIRVEGEFTIASAGEMKHLLLEGLASTKELEVDLSAAEEVDVTLLQLLWAAAREAAQQSGRIVSGLSDACATAARDAGFENFPGFANQELRNG